MYLESSATRDLDCKKEIPVIIAKVLVSLV